MGRTILLLILGVAVGSSLTGAYAVTNFDNLLIDNGAGTSQVEIESSTGNARFVLEDIGTAKYSVTLRDGEGSIQFRDNIAAASRMLIASSGNVGIGTDFPDAALHVGGGNSAVTPIQNGVQITGSDALGNSAIELTTDAGTPYIDFTNDIAGTDFDTRMILRDTEFEIQSINVPVKINKGGNNVIINENFGNVGIGTASPTSKLHVVGDLTLQSEIICPGGACVQGDDIEDGSVTSFDILDDSLNGGDIGDGTITGLDIDEASFYIKDCFGAACPFADASMTSYDLTCDAGDLLISGGGANHGGIDIRESRQVDSETWRFASNPNVAPLAMTILCLNTT